MVDALDQFLNGQGGDCLDADETSFFKKEGLRRRETERLCEKRVIAERRVEIEREMGAVDGNIGTNGQRDLRKAGPVSGCKPDQE